MSYEDFDTNSPNEKQNLFEAYHFAREARDHADTLLWEVGAIVWSGQTLLLGFVLEAIDGHAAALLLIMVVAVIGILMALFNSKTMSRRRDVCAMMIRLMLDIEDKLEMPVKPQRTITSGYPTGFQKKWSSRLNMSFMVAWVVVFLVALSRLLHQILRNS